MEACVRHDTSAPVTSATVTSATVTSATVTSATVDSATVDSATFGAAAPAAAATVAPAAATAPVGAAGEAHGRERLAGVLAALGTRVAPTSMAGERTLPTTEALGELCGGLVRGRVLSCTGGAATSVALALLAPAVAAGSWIALVDVPSVGLDAAGELGMALERVVAIDTGGAAWADVVAAAADGFDVMIVRVPGDVPAATVRKVATRLQQRGVVMVVLGDPGALVCDGVLDTACLGWSGLGAGWGHLRRRTVEVTASGRRLHGRRARTIALPAGPAVDDASPDDASADEASPDPQPVRPVPRVLVAPGAQPVAS